MGLPGDSALPEFYKMPWEGGVFEHTGTIPDGTKRAAVRTVCGYAESPREAAEVLDMLGLLDEIPVLFLEAGSDA